MEIHAASSLLAMDILHWNTVHIAFVLPDVACCCVLSSQCRDRPKTAGDHETNGLSEDRWSGKSFPSLQICLQSVYSLCVTNDVTETQGEMSRHMILKIKEHNTLTDPNPLFFAVEV